jgi:hypothetical protein
LFTRYIATETKTSSEMWRASRSSHLGVIRCSPDNAQDIRQRARLPRLEPPTALVERAPRMFPFPTTSLDYDESLRISTPLPSSTSSPSHSQGPVLFPRSRVLSGVTGAAALRQRAISAPGARPRRLSKSTVVRVAARALVALRAEVPEPAWEMCERGSLPVLHVPLPAPHQAEPCSAGSLVSRTCILKGLWLMSEPRASSN